MPMLKDMPKNIHASPNHGPNHGLNDGSNANLNDGPDLADFLPNTASGYTAHAGQSRAPNSGKPPGKADELAIIDALQTVKDPEIPVNIYELGLIYDIIRHEDGDVLITMSLTAPGCPVAGELPQQVADAVAATGQVGRVSVTLVWQPAWTPDRMSEDAKLALGYGF